MAILFQCQCGCGQRAAEESCGTLQVCRNCGRNMVVPAESQPDLFCVYSRGSSAEGEVLTLEEIGTRVASGALSAIDLVYQNGTWCPLGEVFELPADAGRDVAGDGEDVEAAPLHCRELPPVEGFPSVSASPHSHSLRERFLFALNWAYRPRWMRWCMQSLCFLVLAAMLAGVVQLAMCGIPKVMAIWTLPK